MYVIKYVYTFQKVCTPSPTPSSVAPQKRKYLQETKEPARVRAGVDANGELGGRRGIYHLHVAGVVVELAGVVGTQDGGDVDGGGELGAEAGAGA